MAQNAVAAPVAAPEHGPWEDFAQAAPAAAPEHGPWEDFAAAQSSPVPIDANHADTFWGRLAKSYLPTMVPHQPGEPAPLSDYERYRQNPQAAQAEAAAPHPLAQSQIAADQPFWKAAKSIPIAGALVPQTPELTKYENESPAAVNLPFGKKITYADLTGALGGGMAMAPVIAAAPVAFGARTASNAVLPAVMSRMLYGGASGGELAAADTLARGAVAGEDPATIAKNAALGGAAGAALGAGGVGLFSALGVPLNYISKAIMARTNPLVTSEGVFTPAGVKSAQSFGLDPAKMTPDQRVHFANAENPAEAATMFKNKNEFGIEQTAGERAKDWQQIHHEERMTKGQEGPGAKDVMTSFKNARDEAVKTAAEQTIPGTIAPNVDTEAGRQALGKGVQESMKSAYAAAKGRESAAWKDIGPLYASTGAKADIGTHVGNAVGDFRRSMNATNTPISEKMMETLHDYQTGKTQGAVYPLLGETPPAEPHIGELRKQLLGMSQDAQKSTPTDAAVAGKIYEGYTNWSNAIPSKFGAGGLSAGNPEDLIKTVTARGITRDVRSQFTPTNPGSKTLTPVGKLLQDAYSEGASPESVITKLVGTGPKGEINNTQYQALQKVKEILSAPEHRDAWDSLKLAYWQNLKNGADGKITSPGLISKRIETAFNNQKSVLDVLFSPEEQSKMRRFQDALIGITPKLEGSRTNPSQSSFGVSQMLLDHAKGMFARAAMEGKGPLGSLLDFALQNISKATTTPWMQTTSKGAQEALGAINQAVPQRQPVPYWQYGAPATVNPMATDIARALTPQQ